MCVAVAHVCSRTRGPSAVINAVAAERNAVSQRMRIPGLLFLRKSSRFRSPREVGGSGSSASIKELSVFRSTPHKNPRRELRLFIFFWKLNHFISRSRKNIDGGASRNSVQSHVEFACKFTPQSLQ